MVKLKMVAILGFVALFSRKGRQYEMKKEMSKKRHLMEMKFETEASEPDVLSAIVIKKSNRNERVPDESRNGNWWTNGYQN